MKYIATTIRTQARHKSLSLVNILGLSLGITWAIMIFLYVDGHLKTDRFHEANDRIYRVVLNIEKPSGDIEYDEASALPVGRALHDEFPQVEQHAYCSRFYRAPTISVSTTLGISKFKEDRVVAYADNNFINMFEHDFIAGDKITALSSPATAALSDVQAIKYFGTTDVIGKTINLNNSFDLTIVGVYASQKKPSDLKFDVLVSLPTIKLVNPDYEDHNFSWIGSNNWTFIKLSPGSNIADVAGQLPSFVQRHFGTDFKHWHLYPQPLNDVHFDMRYDGVINRSVLWILTGVAVGLIILVSINYINLAIAQAHHRLKEVGVRKYLGAGRHQLFFQFILETFITVIAACVISFAAIYILLPMINTMLHTDISILQLNSMGSLISISIFILSLSLLAGYYPAIVMSRFNPIKAISGVGIGISANQDLRKILIGFQYTIALIFLISSAVIVRQVDYFLTTDFGFQRDAILTVGLPKAPNAVLNSVRTELSLLSGVESVTLNHDSPMSMTVDGGFVKYDNHTEFENFIVRDRWADEDFLTTFKLKLLSGRNIIVNDSATEILVNETFVRSLGIQELNDVIGKTLFLDNSLVKGSIVGVVQDFHNRSLQSGVEALAIYPVNRLFNQASLRFNESKKAEVLEAVRSKWIALFPGEVFQFSFLDQTLEDMYQVETVTRNIMRVFSIVAVAICSIGILSLSIFAVHQRRKEIGVRKVLGADVSTIVLLLCKQYIWMIAAAICIAIPVSFFFVSGWLNGFAYHIELGWVFFAVPSLILLVITLALVGTQSFMAAGTNPIHALKEE